MGYNFPVNKKEPRYGFKSRKECKGGCNEGRPRYHDSIEEAHYCNQLALFRQAGGIRSYKTQVRYDLHDKQGHACGWMKVDFEVIHADGRKIIHEYKGKIFGTLMEYKQKKALFSWCYPDIEHVTVGKGQIVI